jgi:hypothetical protein
MQMNDYQIKFKEMTWGSPSVGVKQKIHKSGTKILRLLQFDDNFTEQEWCIKGHIGFVLRGEMKIDFDGTIKSYQKGDGLWIEPGLLYKHKVVIGNGKQVELILFEEDLT